MKFRVFQVIGSSRKIVVAIAASLALFMGVAKSTMASSDVGRVTGRVIFNQPRSLPPGALMHITLVDVTPRQNVSKSIITRQTITNPNVSGMTFDLKYDPTQIMSDHLYAIQIRVMSNGEIVYMNTSPYQVITKGHPQTTHVIISPRPR
jgi:putative lipoprotein